MRRRGARRTARRTSRRTARRVMRRRMRRRMLVGGMVLLTVGGTAAAVKLSQQDAHRIEEHAGASVEELSDQELVQAMNDLNIQSAELSDADRAALSAESSAADAPDKVSEPADTSYLEELEKLANLRDMGVITAEDFEAKKKQLLGI